MGAPTASRVSSGTRARGRPFVLASLGFAAAAAAAVVLYRRSTLRIAYLLTTPALLMFIILGAESFSRLLPAWIVAPR